MKYVMDELSLVEDILNNDHFEYGYGITVSCLSKYYKEQGLTKEENRVAILNLFDEREVEFEKHHLHKMLLEILHSTYEYDKKLCKVDAIPVTKKEWDTIKALEDPHVEKVVFTLLINIKAYGLLRNKENVWYNGTRSELFKEAKTTGKFRTAKDQLLIIRDLFEMGMVEKSKSTKQFSLKLNFVDYSNEDVLFYVTNYNDIIYHYRKESGENVDVCKCCGKTFKKPKGQGKGKVSYCSDKCKEASIKLKKREENKKYREKNAKNKQKKG